MTISVSAARILSIAAIVAFHAASNCLAVSPSDFVTITPISDASTSTIAAGYTGALTNSKSFANQTLKTVNTAAGEKYQFITYYNSNEKLVVGRRQFLSSGWSDWYLRSTAFIAYNIADTHDVSSIGIDGDGYLHVSWGMHGNTLNYSRSTASALNSDAFTLQNDTVGDSGSLKTELPLYSSVTYPQFYNIPNSGDLLMAYRVGSSGNGDMELCRWNCSSGSWSAVRASSTVPWINNVYASGSLPNVNAYINKLVYDSKGVLHTTWTWRTGADSTSGFTDYQSNHNVMYAYSPDDGVNWYDNSGAIYQRDGVHAIDEYNAAPVISLPEGNSLINQTSMAVGPDDTVYMASWWAPKTSEGDYLRQYMLSWRDGAEWKTSQIHQRDAENGSGARRMPESQLANYYLARPAVAVDDQNRVIVVFSDCQRDSKVSVAISESTSRDDWKIFDLNSESMGAGWEPTIDLARWNDDGVISLFYQAEGSSQISVLEWNAAGYFAATAPEPSMTVIMAGAALLGCAWRIRQRII